MVRWWELLSDLTLPDNARLLQGPEDRERGQGLNEFLNKELWGPEGEEPFRAGSCLSWRSAEWD